MISCGDRLKHAHDADTVGTSTQEHRDREYVPRPLDAKHQTLLVYEGPGSRARVPTQKLLVKRRNRFWHDVVDVGPEKFLRAADMRSETYDDVCIEDSETLFWRIKKE